MSVKDDIIQLTSELDRQVMLGTAYDTAWIAQVPENGSGAPAFPHALDWLRQNQLLDGSWGSSVEYYHDRVISTLVALIALRERGDSAQDARSIQRGQQYLCQNIQSLHRDPHDTVGFELVLPTLLEKAQHLDLSLPYAECDPYRRIREEKLSLFPDQAIYSRRSTAAHSIEFLGSQLDTGRAETLQEANGSMGNSPSATAYFLTRHHCSRARHYLDKAMAAGGGAGVPLHPVEIFNKCWALYNLDLAGLLDLDETKEIVKPHLDYLYQAWNPRYGLGLSEQYSVPDLDDTAVAFKLLRQNGYDLDPAVFSHYEKEGHFICFPHERTPSIGVHIHLLDALRVCPEYERWPQMTLKTLSFCRAQLLSGRWFDKWHASPFYIIAHAIIAAIGYDDELARDLVKCIVASQRQDGAWGYYGSTCEETAYCLQALITYHRQVEPLEWGVISRGAQYLHNHYQSPGYPALWLDKCLYMPLRIVQSVILSALWMYETA